MNTRMMFARAGGECCQPPSPRLQPSPRLRQTRRRSGCGTAAALCAKAVKNVAKSNVASSQLEIGFGIGNTCTLATLNRMFALTRRGQNGMIWKMKKKTLFVVFVATLSICSIADDVMVINSPTRMLTVWGDPGHGEEAPLELPPDASDNQNAVRLPSSINILYWLQEQQAEDGGWGDVAGERVAVTSLAILAFLKSGEYPGCNSCHKFGEAANDHPVAKACEFLSRRDQLKNTEVKAAHHGGTSLNLPLAALALAETYDMTKNPNVKESAQQLLLRIVACDYDAKEGESLDLAMWSALALRAAKYARIRVDGRDESLEHIENVIEQGEHVTLGYYGDLQRFRAAFGRCASKNDMEAWVEWKKGVRKTFRAAFVETGKTPDGIRLGYCKFPSGSPESTGLGAVADSALFVMKDEIGGNGRRNLPFIDLSAGTGSTNGVVDIAVEVDI